MLPNVHPAPIRHDEIGKKADASSIDEAHPSSQNQIFLDCALSCETKTSIGNFEQREDVARGERAVSCALFSKLFGIYLSLVIELLTHSIPKFFMCLRRKRMRETKRL